MNILAIGLNHKTAPIDVREKLAFGTGDVIRALRQLKVRFAGGEFVLLSTCNRVELYIAAKTEVGVTVESVAEFLSEFHSIEVKSFHEHLYVYEDEDAVRHLLSVTSGLDSLVVGESQINSQVKESYRLACTAASAGKVLNKLFHCAFSASKRIHTTTSISNGRVSVPGVAVELAKQLFADICSARVVVIGAGQMGELLVQHLLHIGCKDITVVNRSQSHASQMAERYGISAGSWEELGGQLAEADIAIASASVQDYLFRQEDMKKIMQKHRGGILLIVDIAVPRNFEPAVNDIEDVYLYSIDDLSVVVEENRKVREDDITRALQVVYKDADEFMQWFSARDIGPLIGQMRSKFTEISRKEVEKFFVGKRAQAPCRDVMEPMVRRIVNKLLHCVIKNVDVVAKEHGATEAAKLVDSIVHHAEEITAEAVEREGSESWEKSSPGKC